MATSVVRDRQTQRNEEGREGLSRISPEERDDQTVHEQIAQLAYLRWQARGCPLGSPEEDWLQAELGVREQQRLATGTT